MGGGSGSDPILIDGTAVTDASGVDLIGGTNGLDIAFSAAASPDTATFNFDATEIEAVTFGAGGNASNLWTVNLSGTDPTLDWVSGGATLTGDLLVTGTGPDLGGQETSGTAFRWHFGSNHSWFSDGNADVRYLVMDGVANRLLLGDLGATLTSLDVLTDSTGNGEVNLPTDSIGVEELDTADSPADAESLTYQASSGRMIWATGGGSGDITDVYDCSTGDCNSITLTDGDLLDMDAVNNSTTTEGLILPQGTAPTGATAEGQIGWETDVDELWVGTGSARINVGKLALVATGANHTASFALSMGGISGATTNVGAIAPFTMTCRNMYVALTTAPGAGNSWTVTNQPNGSNGNLTCTISDTATTCSDLTNTDTFTAGQQMRVNFTEGGTATGCATNSVSFECYPD